MLHHGAFAFHGERRPFDPSHVLPREGGQNPTSASEIEMILEDEEQRKKVGSGVPFVEVDVI
jgi:hypothetical protein